MAEVWTNFVLYNDIPQRHYRQIAAKSENGLAGVYSWEGEVLQPDPFNHVNPDADFLLCKNVQEAINQSEEDLKQSLVEGWHRYIQALG
jgi:hypothetical protein